MNQPTSIFIHINGEKDDVKKAVFVAQKRINRDIKENIQDLCSFDATLPLIKQLEQMDNIFSSYTYGINTKGKHTFVSEQESYSILSENDVKDIANEIILVSPNVEFEIETTITITCTEGYDLCVEVEYKNKTLSIESFEDYYESEEDDEDEDNEEDYE